MAHPYKKQADASAAAKKSGIVGKAEGGSVEDRLNRGSKPLLSPPAPGGGGSTPQMYGTSGEPAAIGNRIVAKPGTMSSYKDAARSKKVYPDTPEGRRSMRRAIDKYDNEYGAYKYRGQRVDEGNE